MSSRNDSVSLILDAMRDTFGSTFATYYDGEPEAIPLFNLPALIVTQPGDDTTEGAIHQDDVSDRLTVKVVLNKQDDFGTDVDPLNLTERRLRDFIGKRDLTTGMYDTKTVKYAIRTTALANVTAIGGDVTVEYGIMPRPALGEGYAVLTAEGHVSFTVRYSVDT